MSFHRVHSAGEAEDGQSLAADRTLVARVLELVEKARQDNVLSNAQGHAIREGDVRLVCAMWAIEELLPPGRKGDSTPLDLAPLARVLEEFALPASQPALAKLNLSPRKVAELRGPKATAGVVIATVGASTRYARSKRQLRHAEKGLRHFRPILMREHGRILRRVLVSGQVPELGSDGSIVPSGAALSYVLAEVFGIKVHPSLDPRLDLESPLL